MYRVLSNVEMILCLLLSVLCWMAGTKAARLIKSGSLERLHRKTRQLMFRAGWLSLTGLAALTSIAWITAAMPSVLWEERILLHAPMIAVPLVSVWCIAMPKLWRLCRDSERARGVMDTSTRCRAAGAGVVLPFQATAIGAAAVFYYAWAAPLAYHPLSAALPLLFNVCALAGLWMMHEGRLRRLAYPDTPVLSRSSWHRALRLLGFL